MQHGLISCLTSVHESHDLKKGHKDYLLWYNSSAYNFPSIEGIRTWSAGIYFLDMKNYLNLKI